MNCARVPMQAAWARALWDPHAPCPPGLQTWNGSDPTGRLAVYRNNVMAGLIDALADTFPVTQQQAGPALFRAMAAAFVRASPPRSPQLVDYGRDLPDFIEAFGPAQDLPWLADLARLEMARVRAYHAADALPLAAMDVQRALASGEAIGALRMCLHPSVQVLASRYAIHALWAAHQGYGDPAPIDPDAPQTVLVLRQDMEVLVLPLADPGTVAFIQAALDGAPLAAAASRGMDASNTFDLSHALRLLMAHGALTSLQLPPGSPP